MSISENNILELTSWAGWLGAMKGSIKHRRGTGSTTTRSGDMAEDPSVGRKEPRFVSGRHQMRTSPGNVAYLQLLGPVMCPACAATGDSV